MVDTVNHRLLDRLLKATAGLNVGIAGSARMVMLLKTTLMCCIILTAAGCGPAVKVTSHPPDLVIEHPKQLINIGGNRRADGLTEWFFHCRPQIDVDAVVNESASYPVVTATVRGAQLEVGLSVKQRLVQPAAPQLIAHEGGHLQICKRIYADAEAVAERACRDLIGKQFTAEGTSRQLAIEAAKEQASRELCRAYRSQTARRADAVSNMYDNITAHAQLSISPQQAIEEAFRRTSEETTAPIIIK
jgi:hypothetical protein